MFLDLRNINYVPFNIPTVQVVNAEDGTAIDSVMIGGLDHGTITTIDAHPARRAIVAAVRRPAITIRIPA